jgi:hypothetical protein
LYVASNMRAMPENEKPPAMRVDSYFIFPRKKKVKKSSFSCQRDLPRYFLCSTMKLVSFRRYHLTDGFEEGSNPFSGLAPYQSSSGWNFFLLLNGIRRHRQ